MPIGDKYDRLQTGIDATLVAKSQAAIGQIAMYLALNALDSALTFVIISLGGSEIWFIYRWTGSMASAIIAKWLSVILTILILRRVDRMHWLKWFTFMLIPVLVWNLGNLVYYFVALS